MSPKHVFKTNENTICTVTVMRVLLLRRKEKGTVAVLFLALHFGLYSLLFVCFNKHTRTRVQKTFKLCCKFMFRQILSSNCLQILKAPCGRKWTGWPIVGHMVQCHHACHPVPSHHLECCTCSDIIIEFLMTQNIRKLVSQIHARRRPD